MKVTAKTSEEFEKEQEVLDNISVRALSESMSAVIRLDTKGGYWSNPWTAEDVDKFATEDVKKEYRKIVDSCRFFYRRDPIASIVVNKMVDIAITELQLIQGKVPVNQFRVYESFLDDLQDFAEDCSLEYIVSGLLIPEVDFRESTKRDLKSRGVKAFPSLSLPDAMWIRDPGTVIINSPLIANKPTYSVEFPEKLIYFIKHEGKYEDGTEDKELYREISTLYPELIRAILAGETKVDLDDPFVIRRRYMADSPYPTPYLYPALESLRHKRNIRRMDYSIASRVISAIQQIKIGSDEYPLVDEDDTQMETLRQQMRWRDSNNKEIERIFQLFTNHTVEIKWVFPDIDALLDDTKYKSVNSDIFFALGMPNILITGETERSQTSNSADATISPVKTMNVLRRKIIRVIRLIVEDIAEENGFKEVPEVYFAPMNLYRFETFIEALRALYDTGNLSREDFAAEFGKNIEEQFQKRADEDKVMKKLGIQEFAPVPHSNAPEGSGEENKTETKPKESRLKLRK
jgi:hypothetical protein